MKYFIPILLLFTTFCIQAKEKKKERKTVNLFDNQILDTNIRSVEFYLSGGAGDVVDFPMKPLNGSNPIVLEFDWMGEITPYMNAKILHCNYNWERSSLLEMDYIPAINEYQLTDLTNSSNTFVSYTHNRFEVPEVKVSGNYVLHIYDENNPNKIYITRRFIVFDNKINIESKIAYSSVVRNRFINHQLDFSLQYGRLDVTNPLETIKIAILQNGRWDNALLNLTPTNVRNDIKKIEYNFFSGENNFDAGNEFRAFDMRSNTNEGIGVQKLDYDATPKRTILYVDKPLKIFAYTDNRDMDGKFVISNFRGSDKINSDYMVVEFKLETPKITDDIYVFGGLSDWQLRDNFKLEYDSVNKIYQKKILLKQGYYNYLYAIKDNNKANTKILEGSHQQTQNTYIILVYYEEFGTYYDQVVGYKVIK